MLSCVRMPEILLPASNVDYSKWAVVACDQFTSQPEYWEGVERFVGDSPSMLRLIYPEAYLLRGDGDRIHEIHRAMAAYLRGCVFAAPRRGFILTERTTKAGIRLGLLMLIDLAEYDFEKGARSLIRPTEETIVDRIPPRVRIRKDAPLEAPHVMLLADDPQRTLIEPLYQKRAAYEKLYDFELMMEGGHLRGWLVKEEACILSALEGLESMQGEDPILFAVGDGNHSLATARQCYLDHPSETARYALVEVVNLYDESLVFEPIHRLIEGVDSRAIGAAAEERGIRLDGGDVRKVQPFLDEWLPEGAGLDYIHGDAALAALSAKAGFCGIRLSGIEKASLFASLSGGRVLPRKAFSMGEAEEKRYYLECRAL